VKLFNNSGRCLVIAVSALFFLGQGCDNTSFTAGNKTSSRKKSVNTDEEDPSLKNEFNSGGVGGSDKLNGYFENGSAGGGREVVPGSAPSDIPFGEELKSRLGKISDEEFAATALVKNFITAKREDFWVVTVLGNAYHFTLEGDQLIDTQKWTLPHFGTGSRTYVTEGGLVFMHNGGRVWWIDPLKTPQGALDPTPGGPNHFVIPDVPSSHRGCPVSFKHNGEKFVGIGYSSGKFATFLQEATPPYKPRWESLSANFSMPVSSSSGWGYSCFIDQKRLIYYGAWTSGAAHALNLTQMVRTNANAAPNGAQVVVQEGAAAYAMGGDRNGNVYNANSYYTFARDTTAPIVWGSKRVATITLFPESCLTTGTGCNSKVDLNVPEGIGPMSALSSGGVIGLTRGAGSVYLMRMKDSANPAAGVLATKLYKVDGDPYMYNDYTGATLYSKHGDLTYNLNDSQRFDNNQALAVLMISWDAVPGESVKWENLKMEARCYSKGVFPPEFSEVTQVNDAGQKTFVQVGSCRNSNADQVELKVTSTLESPEPLRRISVIKVNFYQGE
jgi:hypothetical protein